MTDIRRETLFRKLNPIAYQTLESATTFCSLRGNPEVALAHWVPQILERPDADWRRILDAYPLDQVRLAADITRALERLPRGAQSVEDLSPHLDLAVERAWVYTSLSFGDYAIRTGHVLLGMLKTPELRSALRALSPQFDAIKPEDLSQRFDALVADAPESTHTRQPEATPDHNGQPSAPPAPALLGKREALQRFAVDLTARARAAEIDPVIGREAELRQMIDVLMRRRQNNPLLTGEAGVGKTAVVEGLALRIAHGKVPASLFDVSLFALDLGLLSAGASVKGEFEQRLRQVIDEVQASPTPIILFIDEAHTLIGAGGTAGTGDAANLLKPALARGKLRTIAATTWAEYKKHIEKDPALTRRFQVIQVSEPSEEDALRMLRGMVPTLAAHHRIHVQDEALEAAVKLSKRYIPARQLPDKAVSLIDTACARVAIGQQALPAAVEHARATLAALETELNALQKEATIGADVRTRSEQLGERRAAERARLNGLEQRYETEKGLVEAILALRSRLRDEPALDGPARDEVLSEQAALLAQLERSQGDAPLLQPAVDAQAVSAVVSDWTGIPVGRMVRDDLQALMSLADTLSRRVIGQQHALELISRRIRTTRAGLEDPRKPVGVFLLAGSSGVGKTETALALAETLYGGEQSLITINMSEFQEAHTVSTLKGAPPGYVGYGEGGVLTEAVRRRPYSVVLLDEVEKAHPDVHELFFQVFDKGSMEDGEGRPIDFRNTLILLTTNVGNDLLMRACGDPSARPDPEALSRALRGPLLQTFPAALLGRMVTVPYYPLSDEMLRAIIVLQLDRVVSRMRTQRNITLRYDVAVVELIGNRCLELESGARVVEALLANTLLPRLSELVLNALLDGTALREIVLSVHGGALAYHSE